MIRVGRQINSPALQGQWSNKCPVRAATITQVKYACSRGEGWVTAKRKVG